MKYNVLISIASAVVLASCLTATAQAASFTGFSAELSGGANLLSSGTSATYDDQGADEPTPGDSSTGIITDLGGEKFDADLTASIGYLMPHAKNRFGVNIYYTRFFDTTIPTEMSITRKHKDPSLPEQTVDAKFKSTINDAKGIDLIYGQQISSTALVYAKVGPTWMGEKVDLKYITPAGGGGSGQDTVRKDDWNIGFHAAIGADFKISRRQYITVEGDVYRSNSMTNDDYIHGKDIKTGFARLTATATSINVGYGFAFSS